VSSGKTAYVEVVRVVFDSDKVTYQELLDFYWRHIDPTVQNQQFCDVGKQYRSVIFYLNDDQKKAALASIDEIKKRFPKVYTEVIPSTTFYPAEEYHQDYYQKNPIRYKYYRYNCGRDARIKELWDEKSS
ncbi:TPA: peptide-methionine (S)-S-oxide reductase MsrA, partial [Legionella pneumophila]|nr:peptide-methionine (S)-S-oxide reductase MsrA [Legionella pneumophila]